MQKKQLAASLIFMLVLAFRATDAFAVSRSTTIRVDGMHCKMCAASVTKALKATAGVEDVQMSAEKGEAVVKFDDAKVIEAKLREVINGTGFKALDKTAVAGKSRRTKSMNARTQNTRRSPKSTS